MKFGIFYEWPNPELRDWQRLFEEGLEQIEYAEEMGFEFVLVAEHHFSNYGNTPAPLLECLAIAQRTKRIKIATAVLVLPLWDPLRLAEEVAVLDNLTGGRFICGVGRGYQPHELERFGVSVEESRGRFSECLDVLLKAWSEDTSFTYEGEFIKIERETVVWPKPLQKPHPPLWVAGTSEDTFQLAAQHGMAPLTSGLTGPGLVRDATTSFLRARREAGLPVDSWELGAQTFNLVTDRDEDALDSVRQARWQNRAGRALTRRAVTDGRADASPYEGEPDDSAFWETLCYGSPERVRGKYQALSDAGATFASAWMMAGAMEHEKIMQSIRLMGEEVIPALRDARPAPSFLDEVGAGRAAADGRAGPTGPSG
ncbi:MAG: LLM class flavin-dependent oxidoreductase [Dehalococcoidia bacterium]|nr:LLM class flavin-dependent oxidoreductase [Dehalococcoidia bacterium]